MRVRRVVLRPVSWPAPVHATNAKQRFGERRGVEVRIESGEGGAGVGVAAPLDGYAPDTLEEARDALEAVTLVGVEVTADELRPLVDSIPIPSARFALETALCELVGDPWGAPSRPFDVAHLVDPFDPASLEAAIVAGAKTVKMKVGHRGRLDAELEAIRRAATRVRVRVDANGTLRAVDASRFDGLPVEFVEEPGVPLRGCPVALDESLRAPGGIEACARPEVVAIVLKPMVLGGLFACLDLAAHAARHGVAAIASHTFDGPVMRAANVRLAELLPPSAYAHGLGGLTP